MKFRMKKAGSETAVSTSAIIGIILLIIALAALTGGCARGKAESGPGEKGREIAAIVNGVNIYSDDVNSKYARLDAWQQANLTKVDFLSTVIEEEILYQEALKEGIRVTEADIEASYARLMEVNNVTEAQLVSELAAKNATLAQFRQSLGRALAINSLKAGKVPDRMVIRREEVEALYNASGMAEKGVTLEDAEWSIVNILNEKRREIVWRSYIDGLKNNADVLIVAVPS